MLNAAQHIHLPTNTDNTAALQHFSDAGALVKVIGFLNAYDLPNARASHSIFRAAINELSPNSLNEINLSLVSSHTDLGELFRHEQSNTVRVRTSFEVARNLNTLPEVLGEIAVRRLTFLQSTAGQDQSVASDRFLLALRDNDNTSPETNRLLRQSGVPRRDGQVEQQFLGGFLPQFPALQDAPQLQANNQQQNLADILQAAFDIDNDN